MRIWIGVIVLALMISHAAVGQQGGGGAGGPGGAGSGNSSIADPAKFQRQVLEMIREKLAVNDEQWKALLPKIEKVLEAQRNVRTGAGMSFNMPPQVKGLPPGAGVVQGVGGGGMRLTAGGGANVQTVPGRAMQAIRTALETETPDEEILKKLAAMREAREIAREDLLAAQQGLKAACTPRQEAVFVTLGQLD
jgi:hypothetical protein